jgi:glycosyltransferase involved in cell wall biosynthesis
MRLPVIAMAANPWDGPWMNRQQLLSRLSAMGRRVVYFTGQPTPQELHRMNGVPPASFPDSGGVKLVEPGPILQLLGSRRLGGHGYRIRMHLQAAALKRAAGLLPWQREFMLYLFHPEFEDYVRLLRPRHLVYHPYDAFASDPQWSGPLAERQERLVARADLLVATSERIAADLPGNGAGRAKVLWNAVDAELFGRGSGERCPDDLAAVPRPRLGYVGRITRKVDLGLIHDLAIRRPAWHWALVGPALGVDRDPAMVEPFARCRALGNVHFLGEKPPAALPAYMGHMDVNTMCYRRDPGWWQGASPLKMYEYLAVGVAIVATDLGSADRHPEVIAYPGSTDEWERAIAAALEGRAVGSVAERQDLARRHTWDQRVSVLDGWLQDVLPAGS